MAITAYGFDGSMSEAGWAALSVLVGSSYPRVGGHDQLRVSAATNSTSATISTGRAFAHGIVAINDTTISVSPTPVAVGQTRYDTVCLRYDWTSNTVQARIQAGGTSLALAAGLVQTPGDVYDHPLAILRVVSPSVGGGIDSVQDVRHWGGDVIAAANFTGLPPASAVPRGAIASVLETATTQPASLYVNAGTAWRPMMEPTEWKTLSVPSAMVPFGPTPVYTRMNGVVYMAGGVQRSSGNLLVTPAMGRVTIGTLPAGYRPGRSIYLMTGGDFHPPADNARLFITTDGVVGVDAIADQAFITITGSFVAER